MRKLTLPPLPPRLWIGLGLIALLTAAGWWTVHRAMPHAAGPASALNTQRPSSAPPGPPWIYGRADARVTVTEYADLECPYCRAYFPALKRWMDAHPDVNWQWQHLPLSMHEPAATAEARLAECAGEAGGHAAFWNAVEWIYAHTRGDGQGVLDSQSYPGLTSAVAHCLNSTRPDASIHKQAAEAGRDGITATPTLRLHDRRSGRSLVLQGPVEGDALLSAIDWLATGDASSATPPVPANAAGDMP
ncbi:DsbA family protein [Ralstonia pseudosolanacearum]|uniref:DsbA family protein n=1 Tax=Ralstonia pseudosolanacearum TaxID=1310165 RepID=UPI004054122A